MSNNDTDFTPFVTSIRAAWLNDLNALAYRLLGDSTGMGGTGGAPTTRAAILANLGLSGSTGAGLIGSLSGQTVQDSIGAQTGYLSSLGPTPTPTQIQALLDNTAYDTVRFDTDYDSSSTYLVRRPMRVVVERQAHLTLQNNYTAAATRNALLATGAYGTSGAAAGFFHIDSANNTTGNAPGVQGVQVDIYGEISLGFKSGTRACAVFIRGGQEVTVNCPGRVYGAWTGAFLCDSSYCIINGINAYSDVIDTGSGPNAAVVGEGSRNCVIRNVWAVQYEEGVDMNANNDRMTVENVFTNGNYDICLEMANGITGPGWQMDEAVTQTVGGTVITGYVTAWDAAHLRLYIKGSAGPWLTTSAVANAGGSGTSGTPTRVSTASMSYVSVLVLSALTGAPVAGDVLVKGGATGTVTAYNAATLTVYLKNVTGARFTTGAGITGGSLTTATVSSVTDSFQAQNGMDISNTTNGSFTGIHTLNRYKCLEVFDYPLHALTIVLAGGATAPIVGEQLVDGTSGASGLVLWYTASSRTVEIGDYTGTFGTGHVMTGSISGNGGTSTSLNYVQNGRSYSSTFTGKTNLRNKGNKVQAFANYDQYWIGTGTLSSATCFDIKAGDDCTFDLNVVALYPTGDFNYFWSSEGGDRVGPPTDSTPPQRESIKVKLGVWSTKAPAFNTKDLITFNNAVRAEIWPTLMSPIASGKSGVTVTRSGTNTNPASVIIIDPVVFQCSCIATDALPAVAGTGVTITAIPGTHEVRGTPLYFNLATRETLDPNYVTRNRPSRQFTREFSMPGANANLNAGAEKSADNAFSEYSMAAFDRISVGLNWDLTGGAATNAITMRAGASGLSDGNIRRWVYNPSAGALPIPLGARMRITVEKTTEIDAVSIPVTAATGIYTIGETVTDSVTGATGVVLWYEYHTATTGTMHLGKLLIGAFTAASTLTGGTSLTTSTAGTPVSNLL